jgi:hypothetical protein
LTHPGRFLTGAVLVLAGPGPLATACPFCDGTPAAGNPVRQADGFPDRPGVMPNLARPRLRDAERDRALMTAVAARARVAAEIARARRDSLADARRATQEAQEMYRKLSAISFGMIGPRAQFQLLNALGHPADALPPSLPRAEPIGPDPE